MADVTGSGDVFGLESGGGCLLRTICALSCDAVGIGVKFKSAESCWPFSILALNNDDKSVE